MNDTKKIKLCRVATVPFSFVSQLMQQIQYAHQQGIEVILISSPGQNDHILRSLPGVTYLPLEIPRALHPVKDLKAMLKLLRIFRKHQFDIVHSITPKAGLLSAIAAFAAGTPVRLHTWTGQPWATRKGFIRLAARLSDRLIGILNTHCYADSRSQAEFLIQEKIVKRNTISVIGFSSIAGVNFERFHQGILSAHEKARLKKKLDIDPAAKVIVFIGRINKDKGMRELDKAFRLLSASGVNAHLLLVGPLDQDCGGKKTIDLAPLIRLPNVSYAGYTQTPETYLSIGDLLCLPSYREGFGTVVIEAAAMGIPAVGTRISGLTDAIADKETGLLVEPRNSQALYLALGKLLTDEGLLKEMGSNAHKRCRQLFDAKKIDRLVVEAYRKFIEVADAPSSVPQGQHKRFIIH